MPEPPRITTFRNRMIRTLPRAPNTSASEAEMRAMPMRHLMLLFLNWRMRFVPQRPRKIMAWSGGVTPTRFRAVVPEIKPLLDDVVSGADLTPRLSKLVETKGVVLPGANPDDRGKDLDAVLIRMGLHHFHVGVRRPGNPDGRSDTLVFAEVLEDNFRIAAIAGHAVFHHGSPEHQAFFELCTSYGSRDIPAGQAFMFPAIMSSGHSLTATVFADTCEHYMFSTDSMLDDPAIIDVLYACQSATEGRTIVPRPRYPSLLWDFEDVRFGIRDKKNDLFFSLFSYFDR